MKRCELAGCDGRCLEMYTTVFLDFPKMRLVLRKIRGVGVGCVRSLGPKLLVCGLVWGNAPGGRTVQQLLEIEKSLQKR